MSKLDLIPVLGPIDKNTPRVILEEILRTYRIRLVENCSDNIIIKNINLSQPLKLEIIPENYSKIAAFVNPEGKWNSDGRNLKKALTHLLTFNSFTFEESQASFGQKTEYSPKNIDFRLAYKICRDSGLPVNRNTTAEEMIKMVTERCKIATPENISQIHHLQKNNNYIAKNLHMPSEALCAYCVAFAWGFNILESRTIKEDYFSLRNISFNVEAWHPNDPMFAKKFRINRNFYKIFEFFTPEFLSLYDDSNLIEFAISEGFPENNLEELDQDQALTFLHTCRVEKSFYSGFHERNPSTTLISQNPIAILDPKECVSYGIYNSDLVMEVFTFEELFEAFNSYKDFKWAPNQAFSSRDINKLKKILDRNYTSSSDVKNVDLQSLIDTIENIQKQVTDQDREFVNKYQYNSRMIEFLYKLLDLGMSMRGKGVICDEDPLNSTETLFNETEFEKINENVNMKIFEIMEYIDEDSEFARDLTKIRTLCYERNQDMYIAQKDSRFGDNIVSKIKIIISGEEEVSCIRWSSNYIIGCAYYYLKMMGKDINFDIRDLDFIS